MIQVKWICEVGSMASCGMVRGVVPSMQVNNTRAVHVDVKTTKEIVMSDFPGTDIMVFQRICHREVHDIIQKARLDGIRTVFDIDDALWLLPTQGVGPDFSKFEVRFSELSKNSLIEAMRDMVDYVTCSTPEIKAAIQELGVLNVQVVENRVDPQFFVSDTPRREKNTVDIVWYAALGHSANSTLLHNIFTTIFSEFPNARLHFIGAPRSFTPLQSMLTTCGNKVLLHDWVPYAELGHKLHKYDIALCPVIDYPFTRCKSELKAVESSMAGLVPIMSDMPQYRRFTDRVLKENEKCLLVPNTVEAWVDILRKVIKKEVVVDTEDLIQRTVAQYSVVKSIDEWGSFYHKIKCEL